MVEEGAVRLEHGFDRVELRRKLKRQSASGVAAHRGQRLRKRCAGLDEHGAASADQSLEQHARRARLAFVGNTVDERRKRRLRGAQLRQTHRNRHVTATELYAVVRGPALRDDAPPERCRESNDRDRERRKHAASDGRSGLVFRAGHGVTQRLELRAQSS